MMSRIPTAIKSREERPRVTTETKNATDLHWDDDVETLRELARESLRDPRITNYFSRGHVKAGDVLAIIDDGKIYASCRTTDAFKAYHANRKEMDKLDSRISAGEKSRSPYLKKNRIKNNITSFSLITPF